MTQQSLLAAKSDIESTDDLLLRAMKLAGVVTALFRERGFPLVVVGGAAVEFYTEGGYMSGDIDFCRRSLKAPSPRMIEETLALLGGKGSGRNWLVCGLFVDILGIAETETVKDWKVLETPYGEIKLIPPELALVERVLYSLQDSECAASAKQMALAAVGDSGFDWDEAERLAALPDFKVLDELRSMRKEAEKCL